MKLRLLEETDALALIAELRAMAVAPTGSNPTSLKRAKEVCFLIGEQPESPVHRKEKVREVYRLLEVLFSNRRWKAEPSVESLRKNIKSACDRLRATFPKSNLV